MTFRDDMENVVELQGVLRIDEHGLVIIKILKCYYDENHIFSIEASLSHIHVACMRRKMLFTIFKYLFSFQRYSSFQNMHISLVMTSYTQPSFDQI